LFGDTVASSVRVWLTSVRRSPGGDSARYFAFPLSSAAGAPADTAFWFPVRGDSLRLAYLGPDLSGVVLRLHLAPPALSGTIAGSGHGGAPLAPAPAVRASRIPCPGRPAR
jgi:hypothetical protein